MGYTCLIKLIRFLYLTFLLYKLKYLHKTRSVYINIIIIIIVIRGLSVT